MPVPLRGDFDAVGLGTVSRGSKDAAQTGVCGAGGDLRGGEPDRCRRIGGVTLQIVWDWVLKFNAHGPDGLIDRKAPGQPSRLNDAHRAALADVIESGPTPAVHGVVRWRLVDLCQWLWERFQVSIAPQTLSRELRGLGYRKLSARPRHHAQAAGAIEHFKKVSPRVSRRSPRPRASIPATWRSGSATKRESGRKTSALADGRDAAAGRSHRTISAPPLPTSSAPSVPRRGRPSDSSFPGATPRR